MNKQLQRDFEALDHDHPEWRDEPFPFTRYWMYFTNHVAAARRSANLRILARIICWPIIRFLDRHLLHPTNDARRKGENA